MSVETASLVTPVGLLRLLAVDDHLTHLGFEGRFEGPSSLSTVEPPQATDPEPDGPSDPTGPTVDAACRQLREYFARERREFDVPLAPRGTEFQLGVWEQLRRIPYGETVSYGDIAAALGLPPGASRAVGLANGANPIAIIVPCHRVIGADGSLVGFGGGLPRKRLLLELEAPSRQPSLFGDE